MNARDSGIHSRSIRALECVVLMAAPRPVEGKGSRSFYDSCVPRNSYTIV